MSVSDCLTKDSNETSDSDDIFEIPIQERPQRPNSNSNEKKQNKSRSASNSSNAEPRFMNTNQFKATRNQSKSQHNKFNKNNPKNNNWKRNFTEERNDSSFSNNKKSGGYNGPIPSLLELFEDNYGQQRPKINVEHYRCSDNTLTTGWRPNVELDVNRLTQEIQMANRAKYSNGGNSFEVKSFAHRKVAQNTDERIYEILSGSNGLYATITSKCLALEQLCMSKGLF